jgi:hypothetical protein
LFTVVIRGHRENYLIIPTLINRSGCELVMQRVGRSDVMKAHSLYSSHLSLLTLTVKAPAIFSSHEYQT